MSYLGKKGYTLFKEDFTAVQLKKIRQDLTVKPFSTHSNEVSYPVYRESNTKMYLPRYYGIEEFGKVESRITSGQPIDLPFTGQLFDYQIEITRKFIQSAKENGGGLLDVEPGKGKTVMALHIMSQLKKKTLVVVHKTFLMNQWLERIQTFLPTAKVGRIQGDIIDMDGKDIVLGMLQSLSNKTYASDMWDSFGLCVFDECHHLSAEVFSNVMVQIVTPYNLGLSGTMTRKDGLSKVFKYFIGPVIHKEKSDIETEVLVKCIRFQNEDLFEHVKTDFKGQPLYSCLISKLNDASRNERIVSVLKRELENQPQQQVMILSHTKTMIHDLYKRISAFEPSIGYYLGGMKEEHLKESESKKVILGTYAMASEGLDIKTLTTLYLATPKSDVCQSVGRILRSKEHKPVVVDFIDEAPVFESQYQKRKKYYQSKIYHIEEYMHYKAYLENAPFIPEKKSKKKEKEKEKECLCMIPMNPTERLE
jgi:superfamily II DNA or RNA helicase